MEDDGGVEPEELERRIGTVVLEEASEDGFEIGEIGSARTVLCQELLGRVGEKRFEKLEARVRVTNRRLHFSVNGEGERSLNLLKENRKKPFRIKRGNRKENVVSFFKTI